MSIFIQLGATRDGFDPYLSAAHAQGMQAILIETPDYIHLHRALGRQEFDQILAVEHPADEEELLRALQSLPEHPALILAGFERYIFSSYAVARRMGVPPAPPGSTSLPLNKAQQRQAISNASNQILQPNYLILTGNGVTADQLARLTYPVVIKPVDGGGGLGVFLANNFSHVEMALDELRSTLNYDGGAFTGIVIEEYIHGDEYSVQGIAQRGKCTLLTFCKKFIVRGTQGDEAIRGFRESGHIAQSAERADPAMQQFAQSCITALGYSDGPFHIDMAQTPGGYHLIEINFRLSGVGMIGLIERVTGYNWAEEAIAVHLGGQMWHRRQPISSLYPCAGQITVTNPASIEIARELQTSGHAIEIQRLEEPATLPITPRLIIEMRHFGLAARIIASAQNLAEVERLLRTCSPERAQQKII